MQCTAVHRLLILLPEPLVTLANHCNMLRARKKIRTQTLLTGAMKKGGLGVPDHLFNCSVGLSPSLIWKAAASERKPKGPK